MLVVPLEVICFVVVISLEYFCVIENLLDSELMASVSTCREVSSFLNVVISLEYLCAIENLLDSKLMASVSTCREVSSFLKCKCN